MPPNTPSPARPTSLDELNPSSAPQLPPPRNRLSSPTRIETTALQPPHLPTDAFAAPTPPQKPPTHPTIPSNYSTFRYGIRLPASSPLRQHYRTVESCFVKYLASIQLEEYARCDMSRMPTEEVVFAALLGPDDLRNERVVMMVEGYGTDFVERHFGRMEGEVVYFRIFGTGEMGLLGS